MKTVTQLQNEGKYVYRHSAILFNGRGLTAPQRTTQFPDRWDKVFHKKQDFEKWHKYITLGYAELDGCLNYSKHFKREKGNDGYYQRDGKTHKAHGTWTRYNIFGNNLFPRLDVNANDLISFRDFLMKHGWSEDYFELRPEYKIWQDGYVAPTYTTVK